MKYTHIEQSLFLKVSCVPICTPPCVREGKPRGPCRTCPSRAPAHHIYTYALGRHLVLSLHTHMHTRTRTHRHVHMVSMYTSEISMTRSRHGTRGHARMWNSFLLFFLSLYLVYTSIFPLALSWNVAKAWRKKNKHKHRHDEKHKEHDENMDTIWVWPHRWFVQRVCYGTCVWNVWKRENEREWEKKIQDEREMSRRQVLTFSASKEGQRTWSQFQEHVMRFLRHVRAELAPSVSHDIKFMNDDENEWWKWGVITPIQVSIES